MVFTASHHYRLAAEFRDGDGGHSMVVAEERGAELFPGSEIKYADRVIVPPGHGDWNTVQ